MNYPILIEGGITRFKECSWCQNSFAYLFRVPNYPLKKLAFSSAEEEFQWKKAEEARITKELSGKVLAARCPHCKKYPKKMQPEAWKQIHKCLKPYLLLFPLFPLLATFITLYFSQATHSFSTYLFSFILSATLLLLLYFIVRKFIGPHFFPNNKVSTIPINLNETDSFELHYLLVCEVLHFIVRQKEKATENFNKVTQKLYQRPWIAPKHQTLWCEDLLWKIAILDTYTIRETLPADETSRIDTLFQAVYLLNSLDNTVYPALPKKIMEFFSMEFLRVEALIRELGAEAHRPLFFL